MADSKPIKKETLVSSSSSPPSPPSSSSNVTLKLLINKKTQRVLFAESNKDFVDFITSLLVLPLGTTIRLLNMEGGLSTLCKSISDLNNDYIQPNQTKNVVLKPNSPVPFFTPDQTPLLPTEHFLSPSPKPKATGPYKCAYCVNKSNIISTSGCLCPYCGKKMKVVDKTYALKTSVDAKGGGFVKGLVKYMVMDDLSVSPLSSVSSISLLNKFDVKDLGDLEERVVHVGMVQGLEILKHSLNSKMVLTDVFLGEVVVNDGSMKKRKS